MNRKHLTVETQPVYADIRSKKNMSNSPVRLAKTEGDADSCKALTTRSDSSDNNLQIGKG
jgi:hypothetical protein